MPPTNIENTAEKRWGQASILNSLLLPIVAASQLGGTFLVLVGTNFLLMHAVWVSQLVRLGGWQKIHWAAFKWPLIAFGVLGNASLFLFR